MSVTFHEEANSREDRRERWLIGTGLTLEQDANGSPRLRVVADLSITSLTLSGDLTVDTSTLKVDSTNNTVLMGTTTNYGHRLSLDQTDGTAQTRVHLGGTLISGVGASGVNIDKIDTTSTHAVGMQFFTAGTLQGSIGMDAAFTASNRTYFYVWSPDIENDGTRDVTGDILSWSNNARFWFGPQVGQPSNVGRIIVTAGNASWSDDIARNLYMEWDTRTSYVGAGYEGFINCSKWDGSTASKRFTVEKNGDPVAWKHADSEEVHHYVRQAAGTVWRWGLDANDTSYHLSWSYNSTQRMYLTTAGAAYNSTGTWGTISDARLKSNEAEIPNALEKMRDIRALEFDRVDLPGRHVGYYAQEVQAAGYERAVHSVAKNMAPGIDNPLGVDLSAMGVLHHAAIRELDGQVRALKAEVKALKARLN